jgi:beta-1,2-mannobiose phosphorylase / 1,2-beta-oligomannan phosphorylase
MICYDFEFSSKITHPEIGIERIHKMKRQRTWLYFMISGMILSLGFYCSGCLSSQNSISSSPEPSSSVSSAASEPQTAGGWVKSPANPVLGGNLGTCFDICVLREGSVYRMWFSWRPKASIALTESPDGIHWSDPQIVLGPNKATDWEADINRPVVLRQSDGYRMWYTGQARGKSWIGMATSPDGKIWKRASDRPVLSPERPWEQSAVMCPHVIYDESRKIYRMWYSGGEQYEPNAIGYATSPDGLTWTRHPDNPIFRPDPASPWERQRVTACQVIPDGDGFVMFYIGFRDVDHAQIGIARSKDGITGWQRHPANPILRPGRDQWDHDAVYKPLALFDGKQWLLWYNGRHGSVEQIGLALHKGRDLGF